MALLRGTACTHVCKQSHTSDPTCRGVTRAWPRRALASAQSGGALECRGPGRGGGGTESGAGGLRGDPLRPLACSDVDVGSNIDGIGMRHIGMRHIGMRYLYIKMCHVGMYAHTDSMTTPSLQPTCLPRHRAESRRNDSHRLAVRRGVMGDPGWLPPWAWEALHPLAWWLHTRTPGDVRSLCIRSINTVLLHST